MKAAVWQEKGRAVLEDRPVPTIQEPTDAIVRVTRSSICSSDLHIIHGTVPRARENVILGHEFTGEIIETGTHDQLLDMENGAYRALYNAQFKSKKAA